MEEKSRTGGVCTENLVQKEFVNTSQIFVKIRINLKPCNCNGSFWGDA